MKRQRLVKYTIAATLLAGVSAAALIAGSSYRTNYFSEPAKVELGLDLPETESRLAEHIDEDSRGRRDLAHKQAAPKASAAPSVLMERSVAGQPSGGMVAHDAYMPVPPVSTNRERYQEFEDNSVTMVAEAPVSTFSIDVDTASYSIVRRYLRDGVLPPKDAVRTEELVNYFHYDYELPASRDEPFSATVAVFDTPWDDGTQLIRIGLQGYDIPADDRPPANLVFLVDTSGSMSSPDKLPLLKKSLRMLVQQMGEQDTISIVAYAGSAGVVLEPTKGSEQRKILAVIDRFASSGSTAGAEGIRQAYALAEAEFREGAVNRVILATDGDFNVGISDPKKLEDYISRKRETGVYLSILGFGKGNLNDRLMQKLAQAGNGNAAYIDNLMEARKVLVDEMGSTLFTIADDVKIQVEFNPAYVAEYRLIGYETRLLKREDFNNDHVDAGEVGSGHSVTALYEITPPGSDSRLNDDLRYGKPAATTGEKNGEIANLRLRYKKPGESKSVLWQQPIQAASRTSFAEAPVEARFATAVAGFGQILRGAVNVEDFGLDDVARIARAARGEDSFGYRAEFLQMVRMAKSASALEPLNN